MGGRPYSRLSEAVVGHLPATAKGSVVARLALADSDVDNPTRTVRLSFLAG